MKDDELALRIISALNFFQENRNMKEVPIAIIAQGLSSKYGPEITEARIKKVAQDQPTLIKLRGSSLALPS